MVAPHMQARENVRKQVIINKFGFTLESGPRICSQWQSVEMQNQQL